MGMAVNCGGRISRTGGTYVTAGTERRSKDITASLAGESLSCARFLLFDGEGDTANARERAIGGHPAVFLRWRCRYGNPESPYADEKGYVPYGRLVDYTGGRSNGCITWPAAGIGANYRDGAGQPDDALHLS